MTEMFLAQSFEKDMEQVLGLYNAGRLSEAEQAAAALVAAHPAVAAAHHALGVILASRDQGQAAVLCFAKAVALDPKSAKSLFNLGSAQCVIGDFADAADNFRKVLVLEPANAEAAVNLGVALRETRRLDEAAASYREALRIGGPERVRASFGLGETLADLGRDTEAIAAFQNAATLAPGYADAHLQLGNAFRRVGKLDDALRAYTSALKLKPNDREALNNLGLVHFDRGRLAEGLAAIARGPGVVRLRPAKTQNACPAPHRLDLASLDLAGGDVPTFMGAWMLPAPALCDQLIAFFEARTAQHQPGRTEHGVSTADKNSVDLTILPNDMKLPGYEPVAAYLNALEACYADYCTQWPHLGAMLPGVDIVPFNIQRYGVGGHFQRPHSERMSFPYAHRVLAWMTYLNDVEGGGATRFHHFGIDVTPARGKTLIWPAEWTHMHAGEVVTAGSKYIITGWMHFPPPA